MPKNLGYKSQGDRVVIINSIAYLSRGVVLTDNRFGYGQVVVLLDERLKDGGKFEGFEIRDMIYEEDLV